MRRIWLIGTVAAISCAQPIVIGHATRVVIVGDSVAHGAGDERGGGIASRLLLPTANLGIDGARTVNVLRLLRSSDARKQIRSADAIVVSIGGNDLYGDRASQLLTTICPACSMSVVLPRVRSVVERLHSINPKARVILLGLYNPYIDRAFLNRQVNFWDARLIATFANDPRVNVIRIADLLQFADRLSSIDHFHPSAEGYALIAARIQPAL